jgi:hypothetical protein
MADPDLPISGGCNCGAVRFEVTEPLLGALHCHCKRCQRRSGTGYSVNARTVDGSFRLLAGADRVQAWDPGDGGWLKAFCSDCGGHLYSASPADQTMVSVRMGAFDGDPGVRSEGHQFTAYAAPWAPVPDDSLARFPERRPDGASTPPAEEAA